MVDLPLIFCPLCGEWMGGKAHRNSATIDHFIPRWQGGTDDPSNTWRVCFACNCRKGGRMPTAFETLTFSLTKGFCHADPPPLHPQHEES